MRTLPLRAALTRGAFLTAANWPVVLIDFALDSFYKLALAVPILGGALMVAVIAGTEPGAVVGEGLRATAELIIGALATAPAALTSFFAALALVGLGGEAIVFALKSGTLAVIVAAERQVADDRPLPIDAESLRRASAYSLTAVYEGIQHFGRRALVLALWLGGVYLVIGGLYLTVVAFGFSIAARLSWMPAWPLLMVVATAVGVVAVAAINLAYDLLRVIVLTDDCSVPQAAMRLRGFVVEDSRQVIGIFSVMAALVLVATAASFFAAAGLAFIAWVPFVGLVVVPLQAAAWIIRGLGFQFLELSALAAYQTQYRRFADPRIENVKSDRDARLRIDGSDD
jgi:hypothetical protein